ncbi:hypothetical protein [Kitasatospora terrestris]|uniref:Uncharacterized protein n=1 Tax=Kitasatospora terrestris TaxID=258051 RepID=A0ABP9DHA1_9ACTN
MTSPQSDYGSDRFRTDARLAALALLRTRAASRDAAAASGAQLEFVDSWSARYGEGGLRVLLAAVVDQAGLLAGTPAGADARLAAAEMMVLVGGSSVGTAS